MSIVVLKRKSRKFNHPISGGPGGFSLNGGRQSGCCGFSLNGGRQSVMTTSGLLMSKVKRKPIYVAKSNGDLNADGSKAPYDSQSFYAYKNATAVEKCENSRRMLDSGTANCSKATCYREKVNTYTKSNHAFGAITTSQHIRTLC